MKRIELIKLAGIILMVLAQIITCVFTIANKSDLNRLQELVVSNMPENRNKDLINKLESITSSEVYKTERGNFIIRHIAMSIKEEGRTGVPAYITLAQAILESNNGTSKLAAYSNNLFGIKCGIKDCSDRRHCMPFHSDSPKDRFRVYADVEESFKDHSNFLVVNSRYSELFKLDIEDISGWCRGLKKCGYAGDPQYAIKLENLIKRYSLLELVKLTKKIGDARLP